MTLKRPQRTVYYRAGDGDGVFSFIINASVSWALAEMAAEDYFDCHDGWESKWPLAFELLTEQGEMIERFTVEREDRPTFTAARFEAGGALRALTRPEGTDS